MGLTPTGRVLGPGREGTPTQISSPHYHQCPSEIPRRCGQSVDTRKMRCVMRIQLRLLLFTAVVAGTYTQLPGPGAALSRAAYAASASGDAVIVWNAHAGEAAMKACIAPLDDPFHESRMYAMMHIAIHDALNAIDRRFQPYAFDKRVEPGASTEAAVAAAARDVMVALLGQLPRELPFITQACIDASLAGIEAAYSAAIAALPDGPAKTQG